MIVGHIRLPVIGRPLSGCIVTGLDALLSAVEDSANGLKAAIGAGLRTLITISGYTTHEDFTGAVAVLSGLGESERPATVVLTEGQPARTAICGLGFAGDMAAPKA